MSGYFFVFDGMDGSGKSTALQAVAGQLQQRGHQVTCTREPGGSPLAERIRQCMLADWESPMPVQTELLLVFAARAAHMQQTVLPALHQGHVVLCDRFIDASHIYQGVLGGQPASWIDELYQRTVEREPDQVFLFDLPVDEAIKRMQGRDHSDRFDRQGAQALERLRQAYRQRAELPERSLIDAHRSPAEIEQDLCQRILDAMA